MEGEATQIDELEKEIQDLQAELKNNENIENLKVKRKELASKLGQLKFRRKHPKLLKATNTIAKGTKGFFKGIFVGIPKALKATAKGLEKSDAWVADQYKKEAAMKSHQSKPLPQEKKKDTSIQDALGAID